MDIKTLPGDYPHSTSYDWRVGFADAANGHYAQGDKPGDYYEGYAAAMRGSIPDSSEANNSLRG